MDREALFSIGGDDCLESLVPVGPVSKTRPRYYEVVEVTRNRGVLEDYQKFEKTEAELEMWLDSNKNSTPSVERDESTNSVSRFILGPTLVSRHNPRSLPPKLVTFPHLDCYPSMILPFSIESFKNLLDTFQLPAATPSVLLESTTHFRMYRMGMSDTECRKLGFTIRLSSRGIFEVDVSASLMYDSRGMTVAFLHGCTSQQQDQVERRLQDLAVLSGHPLLLPVILAEMKMKALEQGERTLWNKLVSLEKQSGQTAAPAVYLPDNEASSGGVANFGKLAVGVLGITQLTPSAANHADSLLLVIEEVSQSMKHVSSVTDPLEKEYIDQARGILSEKLQFLAQTTKVIKSRIQSVEKRAEAQQSAVYNYIAQQEARFQRDMMAYSSFIAEASKRDSAAMKGIAILTMVFLPGTFVSTFFAMPILDFTVNSQLPKKRDSFWLYWAVAAPLTAFVLAAYIVFEWQIARKRGKQDAKLTMPGNLDTKKIS